jgi:S-adenosylmethionine hydrolase
VAGPLFTLTTDFGAGSGYAAQMKGVLLAAHPDARIVDVSHDVPPFDLLAGALLLEACLPWFPADAIHLAVVDPGVGTDRRALLAVDRTGRRLLGPDNGLLTPFLDGARIRAIGPDGAVPPPASATFHGRDVFAPAAAWLASGGPEEALGPEVRDPVRLDWPRAVPRGDEVTGETLAADPFGNLLTSIRTADLGGRAVSEVRVGETPVRWMRTFGEGARGELVAYPGSGGRVEIAVREGNAAERLGRRGVAVRLVLS